MTMTLVSRVIARHRLRRYPLHVETHSTKTATSIDEILRGLNPSVRERAPDVQLVSTDYDVENRTLHYEATTGNETYTIYIQAPMRGGSPEGFSDAEDVYVSCSCPFWRWGGCEYNAFSGKYLYGDPRGDVSVPNIRDPQLENVVCKHVYKALQDAKGKSF